MMLRRLTPLLSLLLLVSLASPALALDILVDQQGTITFYAEPKVLGETNDVSRADQQRAAAQQKAQLKTVNTGSQQQLRIESADHLYRVGTVDKSPQADPAFSRGETTETDRVNLKFPARLTDHPETEHADEYAKKIQADRAERATAETVELKTRDDSDSRLELQSRRIKAALRQGTDFVLDPDTNQVTVITPSGKEHVLNHLPDQALERMKNAGVLSTTNEVNNNEFEVTTNEQGTVFYAKRDVAQRRLFGVIPRQVPTQIQLNDATGEVVEQQLPNPTFFGQILDNFSF